MIFNVSAISAIYTKAECQTSNECHYEREVNHDAFTVKLNVTGEPGGEYHCYPDVLLPGLEVKACVAIRNNHSESKTIVLTALLSETTLFNNEVIIIK